MKIGIIGAGRLAQTIAHLWIKAGHRVCLSSRHPERLVSLLAELGPGATAGTIDQAADFGDVVMLAMPYTCLDGVLSDIAATVAGKTVIDATNPLKLVEGGASAKLIAETDTSALILQRRLPSSHVVKAFNTMWTGYLEQYADCPHCRACVPFSANDGPSSEIVVGLIQDAGFDPFFVGRLAVSRPLDPPSAIWNKVLTCSEVNALLTSQAA